MHKPQKHEYLIEITLNVIIQEIVYLTIFVALGLYILKYEKLIDFAQCIFRAYLASFVRFSDIFCKIYLENKTTVSTTYLQLIFCINLCNLMV